MGEGRALKVLRTFCGIRDDKSSEGTAATARAEREVIMIDFFTIYGVEDGDEYGGEITWAAAIYRLIQPLWENVRPPRSGLEHEIVRIAQRNCEILKESLST